MDLCDYGPKLTAFAFLEIDFGERIKAELDAGEIKPVVRGPLGRVTVAGNLLAAIGTAVRGTGKYAYGSSLALMTNERSVRYPDVAVYEHDECAHTFGDRDLMANPLVVTHVLSDPDRMDRLANEYRFVDTLRHLLLVDHKRERVRSMSRNEDGGWRDIDHADAIDLHIPSLNLTIPHIEILARD